MTSGPIINRRDLLAGALGLAGAGALASCSSGNSTGGPLRVVVTSGISGLTLQQMAVDQGFFKKFGVDLELTQVSDGTKCVAALLSGSADICAWSGFNQLTPAIEKGATIKILAGALSLPSLCMYSGKPEIASVKDLGGKTIGIGAPGSVLQQMTVLLLKKAGVDPAKVQFRNVGSNADIFRAVAAKTVDAGLSDVDVYDQQAKFGVHVLPDGLLWKQIPEYTNQGTYASDAAIAAKRDQIVHVLAAWASAYRYISAPESRDAFIKARATVVGKNEEAHAVSQWTWIQKNQPYDKNLVLTDRQIDYVQQVNVDFKVQKKVLPIAQVADMTPAGDAVKLLA
jgi:ABC-type nitrate/sulfonate/bicarbonate transport system substrate-binding protein